MFQMGFVIISRVVLVTLQIIRDECSTRGNCRFGSTDGEVIKH